MIIDHRTYNIKPERIKEYLNIFETEALPLQLKYLNYYLGYYVTEIGPQDQLIPLWGYVDYADMEERRNARNADPAWQVFIEKTRDMVISQDTKIIRPTAFSPDMEFDEPEDEA